MNKIFFTIFLLFVSVSISCAIFNQDTTIIGPPAFDFDTLIKSEVKSVTIESIPTSIKSIKAKKSASNFLPSILDSNSVDSSNIQYDLTYLTGADSVFTVKERFRDKYFEQFRNDSYDYTRLPKKIDRSGNPNLHVERPKKSDWITFLFLFMAALVIFITKAFNKNYELLTAGFLKDRTITQVSRDDSIIYSISTLFLFLLFLLSGGLLLYNISNYYQWNIGYQQFSRFVYFIIILSIYYLGKVLVLKVSGILFETEKPINSYLMVINIVNTLFSLIFIPLLLIYTYAPSNISVYMPIIFTILVAILFIYQLVRAAIFILSNFRLPIVYLIIYLCTLEILPILLFVKVFR